MDFREFANFLQRLIFSHFISKTTQHFSYIYMCQLYYASHCVYTIVSVKMHSEHLYFLCGIYNKSRGLHVYTSVQVSVINTDIIKCLVTTMCCYFKRCFSKKLSRYWEKCVKEMKRQKNCDQHSDQHSAWCFWVITMLDLEKLVWNETNLLLNKC